MLTVSRKNERLVNLTIALLATRRYLTKSEIFSTVEGYEGSPEAKERMFERDKDELRSIGISIDVSPLDPLFNDESGYRILPENYSFQLDNLSAREISLLALASRAWENFGDNSAALSARRKILALSEVDSSFDFSISQVLPIKQLDELASAISTRSEISFDYISRDGVVSQRRLHLFGISSRSGHWYLTGNDVDRGEIRTYRIDRITSKISVGKKSAVYQIPDDFSLAAHFNSLPMRQALLSIRIGRGNALRQKGEFVSHNQDWDLYSVSYLDEDELIEEILWCGDDIELLEPRHLRSGIIEKLKALVSVDV